MRLADLRKLSIRKNLKIRFALRNGMECVITEHGLAKVPALERTADFNLEQELESAIRFVLEPVAVGKIPVSPQVMNRDELTSLLGAAPAAASEHEEE